MFRLQPVVRSRFHASSSKRVTGKSSCRRVVLVEAETEDPLLNSFVLLQKAFYPLLEMFAVIDQTTRSVTLNRKP